MITTKTSTPVTLTVSGVVWSLQMVAQYDPTVWAHDAWTKVRAEITPAGGTTTYTDWFLIAGTAGSSGFPPNGSWWMVQTLSNSGTVISNSVIVGAKVDVPIIGQVSISYRIAQSLTSKKVLWKTSARIKAAQANGIGPSDESFSTSMQTYLERDK